MGGHILAPCNCFTAAALTGSWQLGTEHLLREDEVLTESIIPSIGRKPTVTIKDVASEAGVSIATVSAVVNGTARVSPKRSKAVHVRRQNIRHNSRRRLAECGPRLGVDVMRRACGEASADVRWSAA